MAGINWVRLVLCAMLIRAQYTQVVQQVVQQIVQQHATDNSRLRWAETICQDA
jgi:hypothetical protein